MGGNGRLQNERQGVGSMTGDRRREGRGMEEWKGSGGKREEGEEREGIS